MSLQSTHQKQMLARLRRIEGQVRGIQGMIEKEADCAAVAQQLAAARKALDRAFYDMLACAMEVQLSEADSLDEARTIGTDIAGLLAKYG